MAPATAAPAMNHIRYSDTNVPTAVKSMTPPAKRHQWQYRANALGLLRIGCGFRLEMKRARGVSQEMLVRCTTAVIRERQLSAKSSRTRGYNSCRKPTFAVKTF